MSLKQWLTTETEKAFHALKLPQELAQVKTSDRPDLADYQCNGALGAARLLKQSPRAIAEKIVGHLEKLSENGICFSIDGPGFINFKLSESFLRAYEAAQATVSLAAQCQSETPQKIFIDYGGPNAAKPMHVGHLRSSIIGESLKCLLRFVGHEVVGDIHMGDWGTQMGMLILGLKEQYPEWTYFDPSYEGEYPQASPVTLNDLETLYPQISARCKEDEALAIACRQATAELQQGRRGYRALWQHFIDVSVADMRKQFDKLGVSFDQWFGESRYQEALQPLVDRYLKQEIAQKNQGAVIVDVAEETDKTDMPPALIQKSDGGFLYATTDLATFEERVNVFKADRIIYVIDARQALHIEQVVRAAKKAGLHIQTDFVGFGTMNGPDGKPFKTRAGGVMKLADLMQMLEEEARKRLHAESPVAQLPEEKQHRIAQQIGLAALKFADLQHDPRQSYRFDLDKFICFEGKTGPYLQYACVRMMSIMQKAGVRDEDDHASLHEGLCDEERALLLMLLRFPEVIGRATEALAPHILCDYTFDLAQQFSRFYTACPILGCEQVSIQKGRLVLLKKTYMTLTQTLALIGIDVPEKM